MIALLNSLACGLLLVVFAKTATAHGDWRIRSTAASLPCTYAVNQVPVAVNGSAVPSFLNGSYYHVVSETGLGKDSTGVGGLLAVHFAPNGQTPTASFGMTRGTDWYLKCPFHWKPREFPASYAGASTVTVNEASGNGTVMVVTAMPHTVAMDARSLVTTEAPVIFNGSLGLAQNPFPPRFGPSYFGPGHMVVDRNGDTYGMVYMFEPFTGYRIYRIPKQSRERIIIADVHAHSQFGGKGPGYIHQAVALTRNFIIVPEQPVLMPNATFDWKKIQDGWLDQGVTVFRVLLKSNGTEVGTYTAPPCFSWHNLNAWENETHIEMQITWQKNADGLNVFSERGHGQHQGYYNGTLAQVSMPNPLHASTASVGSAVVTHLTDPDVYPTPEFGAVNPAWMWRASTRCLFAATTDRARINVENFPLLLQIDTISGAQATWGREGYSLGAPLFVPKSLKQAADSCDGAVLIVGIDVNGKSSLFIVDADTMVLLTELILPIRPLPGVGLHNHFTGLTTSA